MMVMIGGALGAIARYTLGLMWMKSFQHAPIPTAMIAVNVFGSLVLGGFVGIISPLDTLSDERMIYALFGIGFLGAFTTFSTFSVEALTLWRRRRRVVFLIYVTLSVGGSVVAFLTAYYLGLMI
ncbi:fluoride efflux transporter CrcB [Caldalkalibacillus salinus]|uniref:fluoride efflux transporter CrcB n=1 Tax=Caldalkalibacillus salinus TaxID=2803787 RepID=UPI001F012125|nr:fluoride efflux transporter CrcB [Caldalkalibacillus salinus]